MKLRNYLALAGLAICLILIGCGNKEAKQREEFINILQAKIITPKGVNTPSLTDEERKKLGLYADHFQVMIDFHTAMDKRMDKMAELMEKISQLKLSNDPRENLDSINQVKEMIGEMTTGLNEEFAKAQTNKEALRQPDDLKAVFDQAFEKSLARSVNAFNALMGQVDEALDGQKTLYEFVLANKDKLDLSGSAIMIKDESIESELKERMNEANKKASKLNSAQSQFNKAMRE